MIGVRTYPRSKISSTDIKILVHSNSIGAGTGSSSANTRWPSVMNTKPPLAGKNVTVSNQSVGGQSIATPGAGIPSTMMDTGPTAIDANLSLTAHNILFVMEFHNEMIANGLNAANAFAAFKTYCLARKAAAQTAGAKLSIVACTAPPAGGKPAGEGQAWVDSRMAAFNQCNQWMRDQYRDFADYICDFAMNEPFKTIFANNVFTQEVFAAAGVYNRSDGVANDYTHLGDSGYAILGQAGANTVTRIRRK